MMETPANKTLIPSVGKSLYSLLFMSRENFQKYRLIIALIVAEITLPTSIIVLMREPNTTNYNYGNNETILILS